MDLQPFRLLDLPQEIQNHIYAEYYKNVDLVLRRFERRDSILFSSVIGFNTFPDLRVEHTCHKVLADSRKIRHQVWPRTLAIDNLLGVRAWIVPLAVDAKYVWLREHVETIEFRTKSVPFVLNSGVEELIGQCSNLQQMQFVVDRRRRVTDEIALSSIYENVKSLPESSLDEVDFTEKGFEEIARLLEDRHGPETCVKLACSTHYMHMDTVAFSHRLKCNAEGSHGRFEVESSEIDADDLPSMLERLRVRREGKQKR